MSAKKPTIEDHKKRAEEILASIKRKSALIGPPKEPSASQLAAYKEARERQEALEAKRHQEIEGYFLKLREITITFSNARQAYTAALYKMLEDIYALYKRVEESEYTTSFYANLRGGLREHGIKIQSNTTDEALLIRFVLRTSKPKQVYDYSTVLSEALEQEVETEAFSSWIEKTTMRGAIENHRKRVSNHATYKDRLERARLLVLRMLDIRETQPIGTFSYPTFLADKWVNYGTKLVVLIGYATRRFDRESLTANVNVLFALDPNVDNDVWVVNELAKTIVGQVDTYEQRMNEIEESVWATELYDQLVASYANYADKRAEWWQGRQQAALQHDHNHPAKQRNHDKKR
jgi:hypothetical protein